MNWEKKGRDTAAKDIPFTEQNWGKATRGYLASIGKMPSNVFDKVVDQAREFAFSRLGDTHGLLEEDEEMERAALVECNYESDCMLLTFLLWPLLTILS